MSQVSWLKLMMASLFFFFAGFFHRLVPYEQDISSVILQ